MKSLTTRILVVAVLAILSWLVLASAASKGLHPDKLIILSTTDVKGKTSPCG
jgi:hypothetical protein